MTTLRGQVAIVGAADTAVGHVPDLSPTQLCINAARRALADANVELSDIDGLVTCGTPVNGMNYSYSAAAVVSNFNFTSEWCA